MAEPQLSGHFDESGVHRFPIRVYYEDTDAGNVVYHANYLRFMERARTEMLRLLGYQHVGLLQDEGVSFAVRRVEIDFVAPARLDDTLEVATRIIDIGGASFAVDQSIHRDGKELARADVKVATLNRAGRPSRLSVGVRAALKDLHGRHMLNENELRRSTR